MARLATGLPSVTRTAPAPAASRCHAWMLGNARVAADGVPTQTVNAWIAAMSARAGSPTAAARLLLEQERAGAIELVSQGEPPGAASEYVATIDRRWAAQRADFEFVGRDNADAHLQNFKRDLYLARLGDVLQTIAPGALVLDAGCGVGRFFSVWRSRHFRTLAVDGSLRALCAAARTDLAGGGDWNDGLFLHARLDALAGVADATCDAVFAFESICYLANPADGLAELVRVAKPGAPIVVSVEGAWGAIAASELITPADVAAVLRGRLHRPGEITVHYADAATLRRLLIAAGLEVEFVVGTHYVADGVFGNLARHADLTVSARRQELLALDRRCADDPAVAHLARAWLAVGRKPLRSVQQ